MKMLYLVAFLLTFPLQVLAAPTINYDLHIHNNVYALEVSETFPSSITLAKAAGNLRNPTLFKVFDPSITGLTRSNQTGSDYTLTMEVTSYKMKNTSIFKCNESWDVGSWTRHCELQTKLRDGGKYMAFKTEDSSCKQDPRTLETSCALRYIGEMKDITLMGLTLMKSQVFAVKAKYEAIKHFAKIWMYSLGDGLSVTQTIEAYEQSALSKKVEEMYSAGTTLAKKEGSSFNFQAQIQYP